MPYTTMLLEDEAHARQDLLELLASYRNLDVRWICDSVERACVTLERHSPDVLFLDICQCGGRVFDVVTAANGALIVATAHHDLALRAFEVNALDYLIKPIVRWRFDQTVARIEERLGASVSDTVNDDHDATRRIVVKNRSGDEFVPISELVAVTSLGGNYTELVTTNQSRFDTRRTVQQWAEVLPPRDFLRVRRSAIVNVNHVTKVRPISSRSVELHLRHLDKPIVVSRRLTQQVRAVLGQRNLTTCVGRGGGTVPEALV